MKRITSPQSESVKRIIRLRKVRERKKSDSIIIEGKKEIELALLSDIKLLEVYYCPHFSSEFDLVVGEGKIVETSKEVFEKISYRENPDGYLAVARPECLDLTRIKLSTNPLVLVLEDVEKPGNLGALLRTADAAGVDLVILNSLQTDIYNPNVIQASRGTIFTKQIINLSVSETKDFLKKHGIQILAATDKAEREYTAVDYKKPTAIVLGAEDKGLNKAWLKAADKLIKIPMKGRIDSLNVSVAGAVIIYEAARQRKG